MKLDRMLYIITYLLNHKKVKAQELAEKFEVSVRTIYRDIDSISQAGIPIVTYQGMDGGIGIVEGFKLDRNLLTGEEVSRIVGALKGIQSISEDIQRIKGAIRSRRLIRFHYYTNETLTDRTVEPYQVIFKQSNWYLYAYCLLRNDFRLFKLRRMNGLAIQGDSFEPRAYSIEEMKWDETYDMDDHMRIVALFDPVMKYSVEDIFGFENYEYEEDGRLRVTFLIPTGVWLYGFLLGFGDKAEILEPPELREKISAMAESISKVYRKGI